MLPAATFSTRVSLREDRQHDGHRPRSVRPSQQLYVATLGLEFPLAAEFALESVDRDSLTGNWATVEIECECKAERCVAQKRRQSLKREEGVSCRSQHDPTIFVLA